MADQRSTTDVNREISVPEAQTTDPSVAQLVSRLTDQMSRLMRQEMALATTELKREAAKAGKAGGLFGTAAFAGYMTVVLLSFAAAWGLSAVIPTGWAFLAVGAVWGLTAAVTGLTGKKQAERVDPTPHATIDTLKDDAQWAKNQP